MPMSDICCFFSISKGNVSYFPIFGLVLPFERTRFKVFRKNPGHLQNA